MHSLFVRGNQRGICTLTEMVLLLHMVVLSTCSGQTLTPCKSQGDCQPEEYCEDRYANECQCRGGYVRIGGERRCLPERRKGERCVDDKQCLHLGLSCYRSRCSCPNGLKRSDDTCLSIAAVLPDAAESGAPTPPIHLQAFFESSGRKEREWKETRHHTEGGGYAGPIAICALIFVSFSVLIITTSYNFKMRSRRLEEVRSILDAQALATASLPNARRASIGSVRDAPPSYNTLSPPSYEQATGQIPTSFSSSASPARSTSYSISLNTAHTSVSEGSSSGATSVRCSISQLPEVQRASVSQIENGEEEEERLQTRDRY